nr:O-antigen ligase family protein [uncultured Desulfuromonas sp.]
MTSIKALFFISIFFGFALGALFNPALGIYGYLADYCIAPSGQWWGKPFAHMGVRFSFTLALVTMAGAFLQRKNLNYGEFFFSKQEKYFLFFLFVVWAIHFITPGTVGRYGNFDHPAVKLTKIFIFTMMLSHIVTDMKKLKGLFFALASASLFLGIKAYSIPYSQFANGRLEGIGGADFAEANFFAAFMAAMLPLIGVLFLRSGFKGKVYFAICGAFTANAVVLCRSRGSFLGLMAGALAAMYYAPKKYRKQVVALIFIGITGVVYLTDDYFLQRITTISTDQSEMDESSSSRIRLWTAGIKMAVSHPLGIGPGNWYQTIGRYIPEYQGKDSHSTYVKCLAELGIIGVSVFFLLMLQSYLNLRKVYRGALELQTDDGADFVQLYYGIMVSCVIFLTCALTITTIYTEILWVLLMLPVCLKRAFDNHMAECI